MAREVKVAVVGDARQLQKELQKAERAVAGFGKNAKDSSEKLKSVFIGGAVAFGAKQIIDSASQLQAAVGGTAAIFGSASIEIDKFAKAAAETSGLSEKAARDLTSKLGASLQGAGVSAEEAAKQALFLTQTGADLAATLGGSTEEAVSALGGALRGEFDPLERFGIALKANDINAKAVSMGLADSEANVSAYAKQQATLALLTERSAFAQGTFAKEAGTAEGAAKIAGAQLQNTSADIGKSFLPIYTKAAEVVGTLAKAFGALPDSVQVGVLVLGGAALIGPKVVEGVKSATDALKSIPGVINKVTDKLTSSKGMLDGFGTTAEMTGTKSANAAGAGGIGALTPALAGATAVIGLAAIAWVNYNKKQEAAKKRAAEFVATLDQTTGAMSAQTEALLLKDLQDKNQLDNLNNAGKSFYDFKDAITDTSGSLQDSARIQALFNFGLEKGNKNREFTIQALKNEDSARSNLIANLAEQGQLDQGLVTTIIEQIEAYKASLEIIKQAAIASALKAGADIDQANAAGEAAVKNAENAASIKDLYENTLALLNSNIAYQQAQVASQKAIEEYNKGLSDGTISTLDRKEKDLALMSQFQNTGAAAVKAAEDQAALEGKTLTAGEAALIQRDKLKELAAQVAPGSPVQYGLLLMISQLQTIVDQGPITVEIRLERYAAIAAIDDVTERIRQMKEFAYGPLTRDYSSLPPRAVGGPVNAGSPYLVGERGPELFVPSGYGKIVDNMATMSMLSGGTPVSGGGVNVTINLPPGVNGDDVVDAIRRYERRNGPIFQAA